MREDIKKIIDQIDDESILSLIFNFVLGITKKG